MWEKVKKLFAPSDMTVGTPWKKIVAFMIPMLIGNIAQQMYNTVDSIVVGRYVGDNALAAVGMSGIMPWRRSGALVRSSNCCLYCSPELR